MAFFSLRDYFYEPDKPEGDRILCVETMNGGANLVPHKQPVTRKRSRGRHDPGDGPYENRIATGGKATVKAPGDSKEYILQGSQSGTYRFGCFYEDWTNCTHCRVLITSNMPRGWGYHLAVRAYTVRNYYVVHRTYSISQYGFTESEAMYLGLQAYNQWAGIGFDALSGGIDTDYITRLTDAYAVIEAPKLSSQFYGPLDTLDADYVNRRIETGLASAFVDACDKLPSATGMNNIANVADIISSLKSMSKGLTKLGSAADAWLAYRYSYTPTKSDIQTLSEFANRLAALPASIRSNGYYKDGEWEFRVSINVTSDYLASLVSFGEKWGFALDAVNAWDLIPYSFIVDWVIPVSDLLERWQSQSFAMQIQQTSWCSVRHEYVNEYGFDEVDYSRFLYEPHARFASVSRTAYGQKTSTIVKRALDVLALFA